LRVNQFPFAIYLKSKGIQTSQLKPSDLVRFGREYYNLKVTLEYQHPTSKRSMYTNFPPLEPGLFGELTIDGEEG